MGNGTGFLIDLVDEKVEGVVLGVREAGEEGEGLLQGIHLEGKPTKLKLSLDLLPRYRRPHLSIACSPWKWRDLQK